MADILIGPAVDKLLDVVISKIEKALVFKKELNRIKETLEDLEPLIKKMENMNKKLDLPLSNPKKFMAVLEEGKQLVAESESLSKLTNKHKRPSHTDKLRELDKSLGELMQIVVLQLIIDGMENLELGRETFFLVAKLHDYMERNEKKNLAQNDVNTNISDLLREVLASVTEMRTDMKRSQEENLAQKDANSNILDLLREILARVSEPHATDMERSQEEISAQARAVNGSYAAPPPPKSVVGFDAPLGELKMELLTRNSSVIVLTAPPGCGKTTLAQMLCQDDETKIKFNGNIMFVNVSKRADLNLIIQDLCRHAGFTRPDYPGEENPLNSLEQLPVGIRPNPVLFVLDDVWPESEHIIEEIILKIPESKILVTSQKFLTIGDTHKLKPLDDGDATTLFRFYAKLEKDDSNIPDDLVEKVVKHCKNVPLALKLIGSSLRGQPREVWRSELNEWSKWDSSVLDFEGNLLRCLESGLNVFGQKDNILKECFLDLGSFPEGTRIPATALVDMWRELYGQEEVTAIAYPFKLSRSNMANVLVTRKDVDEEDDYYSEHFVTQHGMLRVLAIHKSRHDLETERKRLFLELTGKNLPIWWNEPNELTFNARLVSITTDAKFSNKWCKMNLPKAEILILNCQSENYALPNFLKTMSKLKVLIITNYGFHPTKFSNFELLGSLTKLKRIRFENVVIPPLCETSIKLENLQKLSFFICKVGQAFGSIQKSEPFPNLEELNIEYCTDFVELPAGFCDTVKDVLRKLSITHCHKLSTLPEEIGEMDNLKVVRLRSCIDLESLPDSICELSSLKFLDISDCFSLRNLPEDIGNLRRLKKLNIKGCSRLQELPPSVLDFERLKYVVCDEELKELWEPFLPCDTNIELKLANEDINLNWL